jgi:hypothetical protein
MRASIATPRTSLHCLSASARVSAEVLFSCSAFSGAASPSSVISLQSDALRFSRIRRYPGFSCKKHISCFDIHDGWPKRMMEGLLFLVYE